MKKLLVLFTIILFSQLSVLNAEYPPGDEILDKIDRNMSSESRIFTSVMVIKGRRGKRTIESKTWAEGENRSFTKYIAPAREKGTKMLKLEDKLWMFSPSTDRTIQISGHMLRQSVMGSDLSYEDMMEDPKLAKHYQAVVIDTDTIGDRDCWILQLTALKKDVAYFSRKLWVDKERYVPLKEELFAKSGKLLKKMELTDIEKLKNRWFPKRVKFKDMLKKGEGTEFIFQEIEFNVPIPKHLLTKAALRK